MMYGGSLSSSMRSRDDMSIECCDINLDHRLPTSARGSVATAAARLAEMGIQPGRYSGVEQLFAGSPSCMAVAIDPSTCEIRLDGSLAVTSRTTGEVTTFPWVNERWRWSPYDGLSIEAAPRRAGAITVVDFFSCARATQTPAARLYLSIERRY